MNRTLPILGAMVLGVVLPQAAVAAGLIRWMVAWMLFTVFLRTPLSRETLHRSHPGLLAANFGVGFAAWKLGDWWGGQDVALASFFCGITPTAIAAPVIVGFLQGRVSYVTGAFLLSNLAVAASLPLILPFVLGRPTPGVFAQVAGSTGTVVLGPFAVAWILRRGWSGAVDWAVSLGNFNFGLWVVTIFLITSNASNFLRGQADLELDVVVKIALASLLICAGNFWLGRWIGGRGFPLEASQSLGQKNTTFTIYLAMAYASPLVALGPTFYVIWHNLWNSWQLHRQGRRR